MNLARGSSSHPRRCCCSCCCCHRRHLHHCCCCCCHHCCCCCCCCCRCRCCCCSRCRHRHHHCCRVGVCCVIRYLASVLFYLRGSFSQPREVSEVEGKRRKDENEPQPSLWLVLGTYCMGLSLPQSPLMFLPPSILRQMTVNRPHPFGKGRGGCSATPLLR